MELRFRTALSVEEAGASDQLGPENILGFGLGEKVSGGVPQGSLAITVFVVSKAPEERVSQRYLAQNLVVELFENFVFGVARFGGFPFPPLQPGVISDVLEVGRPQLFHHQGKSFQKVPGGAAISHSMGGKLGTLGGWLTDGSEDYLLSCWHAIDGGNGIIGKTSILHPLNGRQIATLFASVDPTTCAVGSTTVDASIAKAIEPSQVADFLLQAGEISGVKKVTSTYYPVRKSGAVSHLTTGKVVIVTGSMKLTIPYGPKQGQEILYDRQLIVQPGDRPFAVKGDSGSLVINETNQVVGLFVGGETVPPTYVATPITKVLDELKQRTGIPRLDFRTY